MDLLSYIKTRNFRYNGIITFLLIVVGGYYASKLVLSGLPFGVVLIVCFGIIFVGYIFKNLTVGIALIIILVNFPGIITSQVPTIKGLRVFNFIYIITWCVLAFHLVLRSETGKYKYIRSSLNKPLIVFIIFCCLMPLINISFSFDVLDFDRIINRLIKPIQVISIYFLVLFTAKNTKTVNLYLCAIVVAFAISCLIYYIKTDTGYATTVSYTIAREMSIFEPNFYATYLAYLLVFFLSIYNAIDSKVYKIAMIIIIVIGSFVLLKTGSRGSLVSYVCGLLVLFCFYGKKGRIWSLIIALSLIACSFYVNPMEHQTTLTRLRETYSQSWSAYSDTAILNVDLNKFSGHRLEALYDNLDMLVNNHSIFLLGYRDWASGAYRESHNLYISTLFASGIFGLFTILWIFYCCYKACRKLYKRHRDDNYLKWLAIGGLTSLSAICINGLWLHITISHNLLTPFLVIMAVIMSRKREIESSQNIKI